MNNETYYTSESVDYDEKQVCVDYIISLATISSLFIVSEVLPLIKSKKSNGLIDCLILLFSTSDCCLQKTISCLRGEDPTQQKQKQSQAQETEQTQALKTENTQTQNVNINITKKNSVKNMVDDIEKEVGTLDELP